MTQTAAQQPSPRLVSGHGLATTAADGTVLDVWFPAPVAGPLADADAALAHIDPHKDAEGLSPANLALLAAGREGEAMLPPASR